MLVYEAVEVGKEIGYLNVIDFFRKQKQYDNATAVAKEFMEKEWVDRYIAAVEADRKAGLL